MDGWTVVSMTNDWTTVFWRQNSCLAMKDGDLNMSVGAPVTEVVQSIVPGEAPLVESLVRMHIDTQEQSGLDDRTYLLVRIAALVATDASAASYLVNLTVADHVGITADDVRGVLIALGPLMGSARVLSGAEKALKAIATARRM
jgi:4-carboxymuconolactone decarboxylase